MNHNYNWFCFKRVLPKKEYDFVAEDKNHISFYKEGEPIVVLQKAPSYHLTYTETILNRLEITLDEFANLLSKCSVKSQ